MRMTLLLATLAIGLPFLISFYATPARVGFAVSERFLERLNVIPEINENKVEPITATTLRAWAEKNESAATQYAQRVLPLDVAYLFVLGGFLCLASLTLARLVAWPDSLSSIAQLCWTLPALYIASDLCEDVLIAVLLSFRPMITDASVLALQVCKVIKITSVGLSLALVVVLGLLSFVWKHAP